MKKAAKRFSKITIGAIVLIVLLLIICILLIQIPSIQTKIVKIASQELSKSLGTEVSVGDVSIDFFSKINLNDVLIRDYKKDTMIYVGSFNNQYLLELIKDKPFELKNKRLSLRDVKFYLDNTQTDSLFNLTKTFAKNKKANDNKGVKKKKGVDLNFLRLGEVDIQNLNFRLKDIYNYQTISFNVSQLNLDGNYTKITDSIIHIKKLKIDQPKVSLVHHPAPIKPKSYKSEYLAIPIQIDLDELILADAQLRIYDEPLLSNKPKDQLYFTDLDVKKINLNATDVKLRRGSIAGQVNDLVAEEKSGLAIREMQANFFMNSYKMEAKKLVFRTDNSLLKGYLRFNYNHMREYLRFAAWVKVSADMKQSHLSLKDLCFFTPTLNAWKHLELDFNTKASGTMNQLLLTQLQAQLNKKRLNVAGQLLVSDLFSGKGLNVVAQLNKVKFDKEDIEYIFQKKNLPPEISRLGKITYDGKFNGNPAKFTLNGTVHTQYGNVKLKETQLDFTNAAIPRYKGYINLYNVELDKIVSNGSAIDKINADLYVDGKGFNIQTLNTNLKGDVEQIDINRITYKNFKIDGNITDKLFTGNINSKDPSLLFDASGKISMKEEIPNLELNVKLNDIDLKKLGYTQKPLHLFAEAYGIGRGRNIDEMLGTMNIKDMYVLDKSQNNRRYEFSNLTVEKDFFEDSDDKYINVHSKEINASLIGKYRVADLPVVIKDYFISYLTADKIATKRSFTQTYFNLSMDIENIQSYTRLIYPQLKNIEKGQLLARFNGMQNDMKINGDLKNVEYLNFKIPLLTINNTSSNTAFNTQVKMDSVFFDKKLAITPLNAKLTQQANGLDLSVELLERTDEKFVDFNCTIRKEQDDYLFHIKPFTSYFGRKVWSLNPDNLIRYNPKANVLALEDVELFKDIQTIKLYNPENQIQSIAASFEQVKLEELISGFLPILKTFKGRLNGVVSIENLLKNPTPVANLDIEDIELDGENFGNLNLTSDFANNILQSKLKLDGGNYDLVSNIYFNSNTGIDSLYANTKLNYANPKILNKILKGLIYDFDGELKGDFQIYGNIRTLNAKGYVDIVKLTTGIDVLQTKYNASNQRIYIEPERFNLSNLVFFDQEGNSGVANGFINYNHLRKFDLFLNASSPKLLCMNTGEKNNSAFYGRVYAKADAQFRGTIGDRIFISAQGNNLPNSVLTIVFQNAQHTSKYGFYEFVERDSAILQQQLAKAKRRKIGGVNLDFDFEVNRFGKLFLIMDPTVADRIECNGDGRIAFKLTPETDMDIKGSYEINSGTYLFTYQNLVQRLFYLNKGGQMTFVGDPYASLIDATATFTTRASAQEVITAYFGNTDDSRIISASKSTVKVNILLKLKDRITQPTISYSLDIDQNNPEVTSAFESILATTRNNEAELNKQVLGLLVWNRFYPPSFSGFNNRQNPNNTVQSDLTNTFFDVVSGKLSTYVTDWVQNTIRGMNVDLKFKNYNQLGQTSDLTNTRNELKIAVSQKLLNDRLIFNIGGNYDFGRSEFNNTNSNTAFFGGDVDVEYLLAPLGNVRAKFYSTLSNDPLNSVYTNKTGIGILFQKEFDDFNQLFKKRPFK